MIKVEEIENGVTHSEKGAHAHFMLKEIMEQPRSIENAFRGRLDRDGATAKLGGLNMSSDQLRQVERISVIGCGTALHSGMVGKYLIEPWPRSPSRLNMPASFAMGIPLFRRKPFSRGQPVGRNR